MVLDGAHGWSRCAHSVDVVEGRGEDGLDGPAVVAINGGECNDK